MDYQEMYIEMFRAQTLAINEVEKTIRALEFLVSRMKIAQLVTENMAMEGEAETAADRPSLPN